jgi:hypothetical protein
MIHFRMVNRQCFLLGTGEGRVNSPCLMIGEYPREDYLPPSTLATSNPIPAPVLISNPPTPHPIPWAPTVAPTPTA